MNSSSTNGTSQNSKNDGVDKELPSTRKPLFVARFGAVPGDVKKQLDEFVSLLVRFLICVRVDVREIETERVGGKV